MLDNKVQNMTPGEALLEAPIGEFIFRIASSIAQSQLRLDQVSVRVATLLNDTKLPFDTEDGETIERSLLELGFLPSFYAFTETDIEVSMTIALKVEEEFGTDAELDIGSAAGDDSSEGGSSTSTPKQATKSVVPFGAAINADYHRKYEFDMSGASMVKTHLVSVPPPTVYLEAIKEQARLQSAVRNTGEEN